MRTVGLSLALLLSSSTALAGSELAGRVAAARWTEESWRADAAAAITLAHEERPEAASLLARLPGLQPERYLEARRPEPEALRDLRALLRDQRVDAPHLAELLLDARERVPTSTLADFPARFRKEAPHLIAEERAALKDGLLLALAGTGHPIAPFAIREVALDERTAPRHRSVAAAALGQTRSDLALPVLERLLAEGDVVVREGAVIGLGKLASPSSVARLAALARDPAAKDVRVTALAALGRAGSRSLHGAAPSRLGDEVREAAALGLIDALAAASDEREVQAAIEALSVVAHEGSRAVLRERARLAPSGAEQGRYHKALRRLERALARVR